MALRWSDIDFEHDKIRWGADSDKLKKEWLTPISSDALAAVKAFWKSHPGVGDTRLFPDSARYKAHRWLMRAEKRVEVEHRPMRAWHGFRRSFATETKHSAAKDAAHLGGWVDTRMMQRAYQDADDETMQKVLGERRRLG